MYEDLNKSLKKAGDLAHYANFIKDEVSRIFFETNPNNQGLTFISKLENFDDWQSKEQLIWSTNHFKW